MLRPARKSGFSLIELMVTLVIFAVMAAMAAPSMRQYAENMKTLAAAEAFSASLQQARAEALRRNIPVELILTTASPVASNVETAALVAAGPNWMVRQTPETTDDPHVFIDGKVGAEGGGLADQKTSVTISTASPSIRFNAAGAFTGASASVTFGQQGATCAPLGPARCLQVLVSGGGQVRLCDPAASGSGDTRKC